MTVGLIAALAVVTPLILAPVALVWYLDIGGVVAAVRQGRKEKAPKAAAKHA